MTIDKKPKINIHVQEMHDQVMQQDGPTGIFTQSIVDEYHRLVKLASEPELEFCMKEGDYQTALRKEMEKIRKEGKITGRYEIIREAEMRIKK